MAKSVLPNLVRSGGAEYYDPYHNNADQSYDRDRDDIPESLVGMRSGHLLCLYKSVRGKQGKCKGAKL